MKSRNPVVAVFLAASLASALAFAEEPKDKKPAQDAKDPAARYTDTVDVEADLPAIPPSSTSVTRTPVPGPVVFGRPIGLFAISIIDFAINLRYRKSKPRGSCHFRPGSNPDH